jgi:Ca2+-transporting ATPase
VSAVLQVAGVLVGPLRDLLGTEPLGADVLLACAAVSALPGLALRLARHRPRPDGDAPTVVPGPRRATP